MKQTKNTRTDEALLHLSTKQSKKYFAGFTLVELIVVITILVILGTIAFTSLSGFSGSARDSSRVSDITNLSKSLEMTYIKTSTYPSPDSSFSVTYSGGTIWTQGTIGDSVMNILSAGGFKMSKKPTDPLTPTKEYTYSTLSYGNAYQIKTEWEGDNIAFNNPLNPSTLRPLDTSLIRETSFSSPDSDSEGDQGGVFGIPQVQAASGNPTLSYIKGNYNGMVAKTQTGNIIYLLAVPSIITSNSGASDFTLLLSKLLIHGQTNSGGLINALNPSKLVIYSSGALPSNDAERILFASGIALVYSGTSLAGQSNISSFISALGNSGTLASLGGGLLQASLGGNAGSVYTPPPAVITTFLLSAPSVVAGTTVTITNNCTTPPTSYTSSNTSIASISATNIATLTAGTTNITPVGGNCTDSAAKTLTVTAPPNPFAVCSTAGTILSTPTTTTCTTPDIIVCTGAGVGQIWAACNAGATTAWTNQIFASTTAVRDATVNTWAGGLYQWGNSTEVSYAGTTASQVTCTNIPNGSSSATFRIPNADWCTVQSDDLWGNITNTNIARKGPCATDYHVPTQSEWTSAVNAITGKASGWLTGDVTTLQSAMKLPMPGLRNYPDGSVYFQGTYGYYWSSSPYSTNGYNLGFNSTAIFPASNYSRASGFSVRCLKN